MEHSEAALTPTSAVAQRVRELRRKREWTAQQLADEMAGLGIPWNRGVVTKLETGRRESVSVAELLGLARSLEVSPLALLFPDKDAPYAVTPNQVVNSSLDVYDWIAGLLSGLPFPDEQRRLLRFAPVGLPNYVADHVEDAYERSTGLLRGAYIAQARTADEALERMRRLMAALDDPNVANEVIREILEETISSKVIDVPEFARRRARSEGEADK